MASKNGRWRVSKYATGYYLIIGFDKFGTKLWTRSAERQNSIGANHEGISLVDAGECHSYVLLRVMHNSMMRDEGRWEA